MVPNKEQVDKNGKRIESGMNVKIHQLEDEVFFDQEFKDQEEATSFAKLNESMEPEEDNTYEYRLQEGNSYRLYKNGKEKGFPIDELIMERTPFYMDSENTIPEIGVERGDQVLVFGFEGSAAGVCRYEASMLEII